MSILRFLFPKSEPVETLVVQLHKMDTSTLRTVEPKMAKLFGAESIQAKRVRDIIAAREG